ncbi:MAG: KH domain-containing protein [Lentisphaerae bacterium]|nr:KH domain-containing protein [Lentisphaerota bacterium]
MKEFIVYILKGLVNYPEQIVVAEIFGRQTAILEVRCHPEDMGRIIGKNGKTIGALRVLLTSLAAKQKRRTILEVVE